MGIYTVTGGASGIGASVVGQLRSAGHTVIVVDLKNADIEVDLSKPEGRNHAIQSVQQQVPGGLDGLIPCAGISGVHSPAKVASVNFFGAVSMVQGLRSQLAAKKGTVVLISSITSAMPSSDEVVNAMLAWDETEACKLALNDSGDQAYAASKRAITCWMRRNCADYLAESIRINAVAPGYIDTPLNDEIRETADGEKVLNQFVESIPMGRPGQAEDIANLISFLLSDKSSFIAGTNVFIDGGHDALIRRDAF